MKNIVLLSLMLNLGVAGIYAQSATTMTVSGSTVASTISIQGATASEYQLVGNNTPGPITLRVINTSMSAPQLSSTCSGANKVFFPAVAGAGVFSQERRCLAAQSHRRKRLHRLRGRAGPLHQGVSDHWWNRPFSKMHLPPLPWT